MHELIFLFALGLVWIIFATVQDLKTREVANWLNFSLIIFALGFRFFWSLFSNQWAFLVQGLVGFGIFFILGNTLYYSRFFAGGDAKLFISLGPILPISIFATTNLFYFLYFLILFLFTGAIYGLFFSSVLAIRNFRLFRNSFMKRFIKYQIHFVSCLMLSILFILAGFYYSIFFFVALMLFIIPYLFVFAKSVEETCMIKKILVKNLRPGDWLAKDVRIDKISVRAKWDGLTTEEIKFLKKQKILVEIKAGIPFVPTFLISYILFWFFVFTGFV